MLRRTTRLVAAAFLAAAAGLVATAPTASAAACDTATGITVVVDFHELGGGVQQVCDASGAGKYAAAQFGDAGFSLERVQRQPGFVCRVNGAPAEDPCVSTPPADAYWGLWWSNGTSGTWTYASFGVDSLKVPAGGSVALSWNDSSTKSPPGATPPAHAAEPSSSPSPAPPAPSQPAPSQPSSPGGSPSSATPDASGAGDGAGTAGAAPSAVPSDGPTGTQGSTKPKPTAGGRKPQRSAGASPSAEPSDTATSAPPAAAATTADPPATDGGGLPTWIGPAAVGALFVAAGGTALVRRRRGPPGTSGP